MADSRGLRTLFLGQANILVAQLGKFTSRKAMAEVSKMEREKHSTTFQSISEFALPVLRQTKSTPTGFLSLFLSFSVSLLPSIHRAIFVAIYPSTCLFIYLSIDVLFTYLLNGLSRWLSSHSSIHLLLSESSSWCSWYRGTLASLTDCRWWFDSPLVRE